MELRRCVDVGLWDVDVEVCRCGCVDVEMWRCGDVELWRCGCRDV